MHFDVRSLANTILDIANANSIEVTNLKMQKLCFFAYGWSFAFFASPLLAIEFEAWEFGPVQPVLYEQFKKFGRGRITDPARRFSPSSDSFEVAPLITDHNAIKSIDFTIRRYGNLSPAKLVEITHSSGTPWQQTIELHKKNPSIGMRIPHETVREFFIRQRALETRH